MTVNYFDHILKYFHEYNIGNNQSSAQFLSLSQIQDYDSLKIVSKAW